MEDSKKETVGGIADQWAEDVRKMRIFMEVSLPGARSACAKLEAAAYELGIRGEVIEAQRIKQHQIEDRLEDTKKALEDTMRTLTTAFEIISALVDEDSVCEADWDRAKAFLESKQG